MTYSLTSDQERNIVEKIAAGDESSFRELFFLFHANLCRYSFSMCRDQELARDVVQDLFCHLWNRRKSWTLNGSLKSYLYRAVRNRTLSAIDNKDAFEVMDENLEQKVHRQSSRFEENFGQDDRYDQDGLVRKIWYCVEAMPAERKQVFILFRKEGFSYREIGEILQITTKTVEYHMNRAIREIRRELKSDPMIR